MAQSSTEAPDQTNSTQGSEAHAGDAGLRRTVLRLTVLVLALLAINQIPRFFLGPYYGNQIYTAKYNEFERRHTEFNAVIMGSMKLYRQLDPEIFDEELSALGLSTFNLAAPTTDHPEVFHLYERLLDENDRFEITHVVMELQPLNYILANNATAPRNYYWHDASTFRYATRYVLASDFSPLEKADYIYKYGLSYLAQLTNLYGVKALRLAPKPLSLGRSNNGYYALDDEMIDKDGPSFFSNRLSEFLEDGQRYISTRATSIAPDFGRATYRDHLNEAFLDRINGLIRLSEQKGVRLVFVIPPRSETNLEVLAIREALPAGRVIELADPGTYPDLYTVETSFDINHLNRSGAERFTRHLTEKLRTGLFAE